MQRAQRGNENAALNAAIYLGNALDLPIVVVFVLIEFDSANLYFGQISVQQIAWDIHQYNSPYLGDENLHFDEGNAAFLEELIVRRELAINFVIHNHHY